MAINKYLICLLFISADLSASPNSECLLRHSDYSDETVQNVRLVGLNQTHLECQIDRPKWPFLLTAIVGKKSGGSGILARFGKSLINPFISNSYLNCLNQFCILKRKILNIFSFFPSPAALMRLQSAALVLHFRLHPFSACFFRLRFSRWHFALCSAGVCA